MDEEYGLVIDWVRKAVRLRFEIEGARHLYGLARVSERDARSGDEDLEATAGIARRLAFGVLDDAVVAEEHHERTMALHLDERGLDEGYVDMVMTAHHSGVEGGASPPWRDAASRLKVEISILRETR